MGARLGSAKRARELARLFKAWRRAFDAEDHETMQRVRRAIIAVATGAADKPQVINRQSSTTLL